MTTATHLRSTGISALRNHPRGEAGALRDGCLHGRSLIPGFMGSSNSGRTIAFVVDDEDVIASTLELILLSRGFAVRSFVDPADAAEAARSVKPDFLLTDVMMPNLNGIELALKVREINPDCSVLLFSGQAGTSDLLARASEQGHCFEILAKPVHPLDLLSKISELLGESMPSQDMLRPVDAAN